MKSPDCIELLISLSMSPLSSLETKARRWSENIPCPFIYPWLHEILQTNYWWPQSHLLVAAVAALAQDQPPYCWPQLLLSRADVSPFALAVKFYWAVLQIQGSIFYLRIAGDLSHFVQHPWICLGCPQAPPPGHMYLFWQASGLVYWSCGRFASLPTPVLEEEPHLQLDWPLWKACWAGTLLPLLRLDKGSKGALLGCFVGTLPRVPHLFWFGCRLGNLSWISFFWRILCLSGHFLNLACGGPEGA